MQIRLHCHMRVCCSLHSYSGKIVITTTLQQWTSLHLQSGYNIKDPPVLSAAHADA